jgi:hypothetical protein
MPAAKAAPSAVAAETPRPAKLVIAAAPSAVASSPSIERPPTEPAQPQAAAKPDCAVPYVIDPGTGKKHFKVECL